MAVTVITDQLPKGLAGEGERTRCHSNGDQCDLGHSGRDTEAATLIARNPTSGRPRMNLELVSVAASIALVSTFVFLLVANSWHFITRSIGSAGSFRDSIMLEAAQRFRNEIERLTRRIHVYLTGALVFAVIFSVSYLLRPEELFASLPPWQLQAILSVLGIVASFAAFRFIAAMLARRRTKFVRDATVAAGHGLQKLAGNRNRVFYDVPCGAGVIDNVIVGLHGVYAVHVVARKAGKVNRIRLEGDNLIFATGGHPLSLTGFGQRTNQLAGEFSKVLKHEVSVRCVVVVPGWEIESQESDYHLIVNERNLAMLCGWKDENDYLMSEEVEELHEVLNKRCRRAQ